MTTKNDTTSLTPACPCGSRARTTPTSDFAALRVSSRRTLADDLSLFVLVFVPVGGVSAVVKDTLIFFKKE